MSDLQSKIAALPEWPAQITNFDISVRDWGRWQSEGRLAALARLELLREWVAGATHYDDCGWWEDCPCSCGAEALLKAMEVPR